MTNDGITSVIQPLTGGTFTIYNTDGSTLLLGGTIGDAMISGIVGSSAGSVLSATVTYTDGAILNAAGYSTLTGDFSWSLQSVTSLFSIDSVTHYLSEFHANSTGQFSAVPEPGTLALLSAGGLGLAAWAWRKRR